MTHHGSEMLALSISKEKDLVLVDVAATMADALDVVRRDRPDVVLVNYRLPGGDGVDVVRKILEEFPDTRVVMLSSSVGPRAFERSPSAPVASLPPPETFRFATFLTPFDPPRTRIFIRSEDFIVS